MENARQKAFQKLRPPCIELSSIALRFRGQQASVKTLLEALEALRRVLVHLSQLDVLDEKFAEYVFFPLSNVFNESQKLSSRCLEEAVQCLQILVSRAWRRKLQPEMGKQLLILLTLLAGGSPARANGDPPSEELICACFECMHTLFTQMSQAQKHIFDETRAKTIVDQNVYLLLEAITENQSESVQLSAARALQALLSRISDRVLLASLLPRTASALTKALKPTTRLRRTYRVLVALLEILGQTLKAVLADQVALTHTRMLPDSPNPENAEEYTILDEKWLKATASQIKLALANVVALRNHDRPEVKRALLKLCVLVCEDCSHTLFDSLQILVETMVMLANGDGNGDGNGDTQSVQEMRTLRKLVYSNPEFEDLLRNSLILWINSLPRVMQGNDDRPKQQVLRQMSTAVEIILDSAQASDPLEDALATSLIESVSAAVNISTSKILQSIPEGPRLGQLMELQAGYEEKSFQPIILSHKSQTDSTIELLALISRIKGSALHASLTGSIMARIGDSSSVQQLAALWLSINFLRQNPELSFSISQLIDVPDDPSDSTPFLVSDLYSITLPMLLDSSTPSASNDWRFSALTLESIVLQANQLGSSYRVELIDTLYPILSLLGSSETRLQSHAMAALDLLARACEYPNTATMLIDNVDYLINSIALKLNTFDISPQGPQVLLMMLKLCGARLLPYLDDMVDSIFAALDNFHGYPRLVELLFDVLSVVVDEATKNPTLAITSGGEPNHRKTAYRPSTMEDILADVRAHKRRLEKRVEETLSASVAPQSAPHRPWTSELDGQDTRTQNPKAPDSDIDDSQDSLSSPPQDEKEPPLSKPHSLLLSIARSTIPHLASPSPRVRLTLLQLLTRVIPLLTRHENSFLPLVNDIWPAILPRLFSLERRWTTGPLAQQQQQEEQEGGEDQQGADPAYINNAAAETITAICVGAGDFMSGRIEDIFPRLERLYSKIWAELEKDRERQLQHSDRSKRAAITADDAGSNLRGTVDLHIITPRSTTTTTTISTNLDHNKPNHHHHHHHSSSPRTSTAALHTSLTHLLTTLLSHTHLPDPIADAILSLLWPIMDEPGREPVRDALQIWNPDAVWVVRETAAIEREMVDRLREGGDWTWRGRGNKEKGGRGALADVVF